MVERDPGYKDNLILELTLTFSLEAMKYASILEDKRRFVVANQFLKAATSIGANAREAQNAESKADFIHKLKIALKEADETEYWLILCEQAEDYPNSEGLLDDLQSIKKVLNRIFSTSRARIISSAN